MAESMFGRGLVVCLAKFSEHLGFYEPFGEDTLRALVRWQGMNEAERQRIRERLVSHPFSDDACMYRKVFLWVENPLRSSEEAISHIIEMWMNAASDHFYDLDRERAPACLVELADLALQMGHGYGTQKDGTRHLWTMEDVQHLRELWKQSCLELDKMLGVADGEWGEY